MYKIGDKVKVLHTDYLPEIPVGSIKTVVELVGRGGVRLDDGDGNNLTFLNSGVEPYQESVKSTTMNKYNLQIGDVLDTTNWDGWSTKSATDTVTLIDESDNTIRLSVSGRWDLDKSVKRIDEGKWKIVSQVSKMSDKIEVGDAVEVVNRAIYTSEVKVGDHAIVLEVRDSDYKLEFPQYFCNGKPITQISSSKKDVKLVSKAKQNMKEVIGYKLVKTEYQKVVNKLSDGIVHVTTLNTFGNSKSIQNMKDAGVLDLWFEPVYKSSEVVVQLSKSRTATITSKTVCTITLPDGTKFLAPNEAIAKVLTALNGLATIAGYKPKFKEFDLGCQTFTIDDLVAVNQAFVDFK